MKKLMGLIVTIPLCISQYASAQSYPLMRVLQKDLKDSVVNYFPMIPTCGLGSYILPDYSWFSSAPASSTNMTFSISAPTSSTMNASECKGPKTLVDNDKKIYYYVHANVDQIALEIAQGNGAHLDGLAKLMEITPQMQERWKIALKQDFDRIFPEPNVRISEVMDRIAEITDQNSIQSPAIINLGVREVILGKQHDLPSTQISTF